MAINLWEAAATALGWRYSPAHNGWIHDEHVDHSQYGEGGHASDVDAEDACFLDGIETVRYYLVAYGDGSVLLTTKSCGISRDAIEVREMDEAEARETYRTAPVLDAIESCIVDRFDAA